MNSAVSFFTVANASDLDGVLILQLEKDTIISAAESKIRVRRLEFLTAPVRVER